MPSLAKNISDRVRWICGLKDSTEVGNKFERRVNEKNPTKIAAQADRWKGLDVEINREMATNISGVRG